MAREKRGDFNDAAAGRRKKRGGMLISEYKDVKAQIAELENSLAAEADEAKVADIHEQLDATETLLDKMEDAMDGIHNDPGSFEKIIVYGTQPLEELGKIAKDILRVQTQFGETVKVMTIEIDKVNSGFSGLGLDKLVDGVKKMAVGAAGATATGITGLFRGGKKLIDSITGADKKKTEEERHVQEMIDNLPQMYFEMQKMSQGLKGAEEGIIAVMKEAEKLGMARVDAVMKLNVYLGAAPEVLRRYDEIYIKEAADAYESNPDPENQLNMESIGKAKENFIDQYRILEGSRAQGIAAAQQLKMMIDEMEKQRKMIQQFRTIRESEWLALLSTAGIAASSLKVGEMIKKSDQMGDKVHGMTTDMMEKAHQMTLESRGRGTIDPAKLIESVQRMEKMIEQETTARQQRLKEIEASRAAMRAAADKLLGAVEEARADRFLESTKPAADAAPAQAPVNDNAGKKEDQPAPKKTGTDGPSIG